MAIIQVGYKTILHLAIDEDDFDATPYVEALLKVLHRRVTGV